MADRQFPLDCLQPRNIPATRRSCSPIEEAEALPLAQDASCGTGRNLTGDGALFKKRWQYSGINKLGQIVHVIASLWIHFDFLL
jgi:hypothetical protein